MNLLKLWIILSHLRNSYSRSDVILRNLTSPTQSSFHHSLDCNSRRKNASIIPFGTPPKFKQDKMQAYEVGYYGHRVELKCPFKQGCPKSRAMWYKDGREVKRGNRRNSSRVFISRSGKSLTIEDNRAEDDGEYTCVVRNLFGSIRHTIRVKSTSRVVAARYKN